MCSRLQGLKRPNIDKGRAEERGILKYMVNSFPFMLPYPVCDDKYASYFMIFAHTDLLGPVLPELFGGSAFSSLLWGAGPELTQKILELCVSTQAITSISTSYHYLWLLEHRTLNGVYHRISKNDPLNCLELIHFRHQPI